VPSACRPPPPLTQNGRGGPAIGKASHKKGFMIRSSSVAVLSEWTSVVEVSYQRSRLWVMGSELAFRIAGMLSVVLTGVALFH
jgi:hypothetical protein